VGVSPFLRRAYELARPHHTHPNPRVGAVVVDPEGRVLGEGAHQGPGSPHAEVVAVEGAGQARGCTVYVSLEPCTHHGRTPPCADMLIEAGVARVIVGALDPDVRVSGGGVEKLRAAGIDVEVADDPEARLVDPAYFRHRETGMPAVTIKYAMTLDGSAAAVDGSSQWITSEVSRLDAHELRSSVDAVVVGAGTLRTDDPGLDVRLPDYHGPQPRPVILAGVGELPPAARIWKREPLVVSATDRDLPGGELVVVAGDRLPDPAATCRALADLGLLSLMLEGGAAVAGAWWSAGVITDGVAYVGAVMGGGSGIQPVMGRFETIGDARSVRVSDVRRIGDDIRIQFVVED